jgi:hypothetical protein
MAAFWEAAEAGRETPDSLGTTLSDATRQTSKALRRSAPQVHYLDTRHIYVV